MPRKRTVDEAYFQERTTAGPNGCVLWTGFRNKCGYGQMWPFKGEQRAHRVAHLVFKGPIPEGLQVLHKCDNPPCVNPEHLFLGTHLDNINDKCAKGRASGASRPGAEHPQAKLSVDDAEMIRGSAAPSYELAAYFGVHAATIRRVKRGATYGGHQGI